MDPAVRCRSHLTIHLLEVAVVVLTVLAVRFGAEVITLTKVTFSDKEEDPGWYSRVPDFNPQPLEILDVGYLVELLLRAVHFLVVCTCRRSRRC